MTSQEAWLFPILGSCTLVTLFLAFKYLNKVGSGKYRLTNGIQLNSGIAALCRK